MMSAFPFTEAEWHAMSELSRGVLNATLAEDDILRASRFVELSECLHELRERYGDHPVLLETEADFADDTATRKDLYERALQLALANSLRTLSIRIALARLLLEDLERTDLARAELLSCSAEAESTEDDYERKEWHELLERTR